MRIRGLLRIRVANEEYRSSYPSFEVSPSISLLSLVIVELELELEGAISDPSALA